MEKGRAFVSKGLQDPASISADAARLHDMALKATERCGDMRRASCDRHTERLVTCGGCVQG